ncbi:hypothetical protein [Candidatus Nitrospira bockiana]
MTVSSGARIPARLTRLLAYLLFALLPALAMASTPMVNDPNGFAGITWGSALREADGFSLVDSGERVKGYTRTQEPPALGEIKVESLQFYTVDGKFARVTVRYHGKAVHDQILAYLQSRYGPIDRTPGQMARGLNQQYNWRGADTEINVTYQAQGDRGFVFFESRTFAPLFNDMLPEHGY